DGVKQTVVRYTDFDQLGNVMAYQIEVLTGTPYTNKYRYEYARYDSYKEKVVHGSSSHFQPGDTTSDYDVNGNLVAVTDRFNASSSRSFVNDQAGHILNKTENGVTHYNFYVNGKPGGSTGAAGNADFDFNYTPVSEQYPAATPGKYVASAGETLRSIAQAVYGDAQLWYLIADANGIRSDDELRAGKNLTIPNRITNLHNDTGTFKPYAPGAIVGDTTPTLPEPPPPPVRQQGDSGCGTLGIIIMVVVTIVVAIYAREALSSLEPLWAAVLGSMAGSAAGQMVGMALGVQEDFSWKAVALAGLSAGVTQGVGSGSIDPWVKGLEAAAGSVATQGIAVITGLQEKFDWRAVTALAVAAGMGEWAGQQLAPAAGQALTETERAARRILTGLASNVSRQMVKGGAVTWTDVAADAFGNALGSSVAQNRSQSQQEELASTWNAQNQAALDRAVAGPGYSEGDYWNSAARTTADQYADTFGGDAVNTGDRLRLSSGSANGVDAKHAGVLDDAELGRLQARELDLIAQNIRLGNLLADQREQDYIANSDYREGRRLENLNVGDSPIYPGYDEFGILTNPAAAPIGNSIGYPLARALGNTVEGMHDFKYGAMSSIDIEGQIAVHAGDDAALLNAGLRHTMLDLMLPGTPQEVGLGVAGGPVIGKAFSWAGSTITRIAAESGNFQFLTRDIGSAVGEYADGLWSRVGSEFGGGSGLRAGASADTGSVLASGSKGTVFSGHGGYEIGRGITVVPEGTSLTVYSKFGGTITDRLGNVVETGGDLSKVYSRTYGAGDRMPNYTLYAPDGLALQGSPVTVSRPTRLSDLLKPGMGQCQWAACTYNWRASNANTVFDTVGIGNRQTKQWITIYSKD
ncbi:MAG: LysM domain-containing protein, partial [Pseudomonadota bacterium]